MGEGTKPTQDRRAEAIRRAVFLRNICADLSRRADPDHRTEDEIDVLGTAMTLLEELDGLEVDAPDYTLNRAYVLKQVASLASNAINTNTDIGDGIKAFVTEEASTRRLRSSFEDLTFEASKNEGESREGAPALDPDPLSHEHLQRADDLLRRVLRRAWNTLFDDQAAEATDALRSAVHFAIGSLLWDKRNDTAQGGRHPRPLDAQDRTWRERLKDELVTRLRETDDPLHRSIAARLIAGLSYAMNNVPREDAEAVVEIAYSPTALAQLTDWPTFAHTLGSFHNIVISLRDPERKEGDGTERAFEAQARLVTRGAALLTELLADDAASDERIRSAGATLATAVTVFAHRFDDQTLAPALQQSWRDVAAVLGPALDRLEVGHTLLLFFSIPDQHGFADETSDLIGMRFADVPGRLRPLLEAGKVAGFDLRHHNRKQIAYHVHRYVVQGPAPEREILRFLDQLHRHIGDPFLAEACGAIANGARSDLPVERIQTLAGWTGADGRTEPVLDVDGERARAIRALWIALTRAGKPEQVCEAIESFWTEPTEHSLNAILRRTLAMLGFADLVNTNHAGTTSEARWASRLQTLRAGREVDYRTEATMGRDLARAWSAHDRAVAEATANLAQASIAAGGPVEPWRAPASRGRMFSADAELDRRLAKIVMTRLTTPADPDTALADLERIRPLAERGGSHILTGALIEVWGALPHDHPERDAVERARRTLTTKQPARAATPATHTLSDQARQRIEARAIGAGDWHLPPPYPATWLDVEPSDVASQVQRALNTVPEDQVRSRIDLVDAVRARRTACPFYPKHDLVEILIDDGHVFRSMSVLFGPKRATWLTGVSPPIHELNSTVPIDLDDGRHAESYLRFFCGYVQGEEGPFTVLMRQREVESLVRQGETLTREEADSVEERFAAIEESNGSTDSPVDEKGRHRIAAAVAYASTLFAADFAIHSTGMVEMLDDEPLVTGDRLRTERFVHGWRVRTDTSTSDKASEHGATD